MSTITQTGVSILLTLSCGMRTAAPKDRSYLESLNLKSLRKDRKPEDQPAREFYEALQQEATTGPLFSDDTLRVVEHAPDLPKHLTKWLADYADSDFVKNLDAAGWNKLVKWANRPGIDKLLKDKSAGTPNGVEVSLMFYDENEVEREPAGIDVGGGYRVVEITDVDEAHLEGREMQNCLADGAYDDDIGGLYFRLYSLRDSRGHAHANIEVSGDVVMQCVGKQNKIPAQKYNAPLIKFFEHMDLPEGVLFLEDAHIPDSLLTKLVRHDADVIRARVAYHSKSADVLKQLAEDDSDVVRMNVADNKRTLAATLSSLADDTSQMVLESLARNRNTPVSVLRKLAKDWRRSVRDAAKQNPKFPK